MEGWGPMEGRRTDERLGTADVAAATGYSVQQVRDLEARGVIAPAHRAANGYRRFSALHVRDLSAYRDLAAAVGPVPARRTMRVIRTAPRDEAAALVGSLHAGLVREREEALAARDALLAIRAEAGSEAASEAGPPERDAMTITELSGALGVRASTLRFWERSGLLAPERVATRAGSARRYPLGAIREARIVAALRSAGYRIPDVRRAVAALRGLHGAEEPLDALEARVGAIAERTLALLRAGTVLGAIIGEGTRRG
ncbi:MerR family transcriptional regulator [Nocardiopsis baichengensis]|uniref:MerR family transcriptional regulator n=1 Tax=Nocardiopsis baichengensis TaxID=280240 RepID=UPI001EFA0060|nr:MerR family transcriptional regulator [Nocardiopsis baichengensis]